MGYCIEYHPVRKRRRLLSFSFILMSVAFFGLFLAVTYIYWPEKLYLLQNYSYKYIYSMIDEAMQVFASISSFSFL